MKAGEQNDALTTLLNQAEETKRALDEAAQRQQKFNKEKANLEAKKLQEEQDREILQAADSKQGTKTLSEKTLGTKTERALSDVTKQEAKALEQQQKADEELEKKVTGLYNAFSKATVDQKKQHPEFIAKVIATDKQNMQVGEDGQKDPFLTKLLADQGLLVAMDANGKTTYDYLIEQGDKDSIAAAAQVKNELTERNRSPETCTQIYINALAAGNKEQATEFYGNTDSAYVDKQGKSFLEHLFESKGDFNAEITKVIADLNSDNDKEKQILNKGFAAAVKAKNSACLDAFTDDKVDLEAKLFDNDKTAIEHAVSDPSKEGIETTKKLIGLYKAKIKTLIANDPKQKQFHEAYHKAFETAITAEPASPKLIQEFADDELPKELKKEMTNSIAAKGGQVAIDQFFSSIGSETEPELKDLPQANNLESGKEKTNLLEMQALASIACEHGNTAFLEGLAAKAELQKDEYNSLLTEEQQQTLRITELCKQGNEAGLKKLLNTEDLYANNSHNNPFLSSIQMEKLNAAIDAKEKEEKRKAQEAKEREEIRRAAGQESSIDPTQQGEQRKWIGSSMVNKQKIIGDPDKAHLLEMPVAGQHGKFEYKITNNQAPNDVGTQTMRIPRKGSTPPSWDMIQFDNETGAIIKHYVQDKAGHIYTREDMEAANSLGTSKIGPQTMGIIEALHSGAAVEIEPQKTPTTDLTPPPKEPLKRSQSSPNLRHTLQGTSLSGNIQPTIGKVNHNNTIHDR